MASRYVELYDMIVTCMQLHPQLVFWGEKCEALSMTVVKKELTVLYEFLRATKGIAIYDRNRKKKLFIKVES